MTASRSGVSRARLCVHACVRASVPCVRMFVRMLVRLCECACMHVHVYVCASMMCSACACSCARLDVDALEAEERLQGHAILARPRRHEKPLRSGEKKVVSGKR